MGAVAGPLCGRREPLPDPKMKRISILHAPSPLGLKPQLEGRVSGVRRAPDVLRAAGLHERLGGAFAGVVEPPPYVEAIDPVTRVRNGEGIARYSVELADAIEPVLDEGAFALVLGGDCSILIGAALALGRRGRHGVVYVDAHPDYLTVEQSTTGGVAGLPLAIVTGLGPDGLTNLEGRAPYVASSDVVVVGSRDDYQVHGAPGARTVDGTSIRAHDLDEIRARTPRDVAADVMRGMELRGVDGVWLHLDVDALDSAIMPAVDSPEPDGLVPAELVELLLPMIAHPLVRGLEVTIYDPDRDPDGSAARLLVDVLVAALAPLRAFATTAA